MIVTHVIAGATLLAAFASPIGTTPEPRVEPAPTPAPAPAAPATTDQRRYCFETEAIATRIVRQVCRTRVGWRREGVDVDGYLKR